MQQEAAVTNIEMKGEEVVEHMDKGNEQIGTAIVHARNTRKWKWWCLCITSMSLAPTLKEDLC
jgi:syntaxin 1B/2/3